MMIAAVNAANSVPPNPLSDDTQSVFHQTLTVVATDETLPMAIATAMVFQSNGCSSSWRRQINDAVTAQANNAIVDHCIQTRGSPTEINGINNAVVVTVRPADHANGVRSMF